VPGVHHAPAQKKSAQEVCKGKGPAQEPSHKACCRTRRRARNSGKILPCLNLRSRQSNSKSSKVNSGTSLSLPEPMAVAIIPILGVAAKLCDAQQPVLRDPKAVVFLRQLPPTVRGRERRRSESGPGGRHIPGNHFLPAGRGFLNAAASARILSVGAGLGCGRFPDAALPLQVAARRFSRPKRQFVGLCSPALDTIVGRVSDWQEGVLHGRHNNGSSDLGPP
jgi:hypothetical protein